MQGTRSHRDGIGARLKVVTKSGIQYNHMTTSAGPVHFGLGVETVAALVQILWPSGQVQQLHNLAADRIVPIREPAP